MLEISPSFHGAAALARQWVVVVSSEASHHHHSGWRKGRERFPRQLDYKVPEAKLRDALGMLVRSFLNTPTTAIARQPSPRKSIIHPESPAKRCRTRAAAAQIMGTVLERNNPHGGDLAGRRGGPFFRLEYSVREMFGVPAARLSLPRGLLGADAAPLVHLLMRRSLRMDGLPGDRTSRLGRVLHLAVTVSSLARAGEQPAMSSSVDDLTDVPPRAEIGEWQEVARRIAMRSRIRWTPIQRSARAAAAIPERARPLPISGYTLLGIGQSWFKVFRALIERGLQPRRSGQRVFANVRFPTAKCAHNANTIVP